MEITKIMTFDAGHRLVGHQGKCKGLHGHTYKVEVTVAAEVLDELGMVIDFSDLKELMREHIDEKFDHKFIFNKDDPILTAMKNLEFDGDDSIVIVPYNPTAENIGQDIFQSMAGELPRERGIHLKYVKIWETPTGFAVITSTGAKSFSFSEDELTDKYSHEDEGLHGEGE